MKFDSPASGRATFRGSGSGRSVVEGGTISEEGGGVGGRRATGLTKGGGLFGAGTGAVTGLAVVSNRSNTWALIVAMLLRRTVSLFALATLKAAWRAPSTITTVASHGDCCNTARRAASPTGWFARHCLLRSRNSSLAPDRNRTFEPDGRLRIDTSRSVEGLGGLGPYSGNDSRTAPLVMTLEGNLWTPDGFGIASDVSNSATTRHPKEWPTRITGAPSAAARRAASTTSWTFAPIWEGKLPAHLPLAIVVVLPKVASACVSAAQSPPPAPGHTTNVGRTLSAPSGALRFLTKASIVVF
mmetsp:Transcript_3282/g.8011  ORF Transcript_3282/g.8011 Transcript_3282/m.8011 type:complete len:299 (+) Transcript_3282:103-999(+)